MVMVGVLCLALGHLGGSAAEVTRAQTAADAAALAGAADGEAGARSLARANGARLVSFRIDGHEVEVIVTIGKSTARARARSEGGG
jgi:capsid protein